jgi:hypothetical protein
MGYDPKLVQRRSPVNNAPSVTGATVGTEHTMKPLERLKRFDPIQVKADGNYWDVTTVETRPFDAGETAGILGTR